MNNLKDYREKELTWYVITNVSILILLSGMFIIDISKDGIELFKLILDILNTTIIFAVIFCFILVTDSLFSSKIKLSLLYVCFSRLPGETIFSDMRSKNIDERFTKEQAITKYSQIYENLPTILKERYRFENSKWYSIYNKHRDVTMIAISNRDYLLCRDIYFSTLSMIVLYALLTFAFNILVLDYRYILYLFAMLVLTNIATRYKGKRFVCNVIAIDIQEK